MPRKPWRERIPEPKCPRCGTSNVTRHAHPPPSGQATPYASLLDEGYRCGDCKLTESKWNNDEGYEAFKRRWSDWDEMSFGCYGARLMMGNAAA